MQVTNPQAFQNKAAPQEEDADTVLESVLQELGDEDDYPSTAAFKKAIKNSMKTMMNISEKKMEKIVERHLEKQSVGPRTASKYKDFNEVVTPENLSRFIESNKVINDLIERAENPFEAAYEYIKNHKDFNTMKREESSSKRETQSRIKKNAETPKVGGNARREVANIVSSFRGMTAEQKKALVSETERFARYMR
jgi:hypothetical protein